MDIEIKENLDIAVVNGMEVLKIDSRSMFETARVDMGFITPDGEILNWSEIPDEYHAQADTLVKGYIKQMYKAKLATATCQADGYRIRQEMADDWLDPALESNVADYNQDYDNECLTVNFKDGSIYLNEFGDVQIVKKEN